MKIYLELTKSAFWFRILHHFYEHICLQNYFYIIDYEQMD